MVAVTFLVFVVSMIMIAVTFLVVVVSMIMTAVTFSRSSGDYDHDDNLTTTT